MVFIYWACLRQEAVHSFSVAITSQSGVGYSVYGGSCRRPASASLYSALVLWTYPLLSLPLKMTKRKSDEVKR